MSNYRSLTRDEKGIDILKHCIDLKYTDVETQEKLFEGCGYRWSLVSIRRNRVKLGFRKKSIKDPEPKGVKPSLSLPPPGLTDIEKATWFIKDFMNSHLYKMLKKQFSADEIDTYTEEYGRLCCQFEDIVVSEFFQIDKYLKHRILINRQLIFTRSLQQEIDVLALWTSSNPMSQKDSSEEAMKKVEANRSLGEKRSQLQKAQDRYDKLVKEEESMSKSLNATRKDRMDQLSGGKETFVNLVSMIQHSEKERNSHGRLAALTKLAAYEITQESRKLIEFPDGEIDSVLIDHVSASQEDDE